MQRVLLERLIKGNGQEPTGRRWMQVEAANVVPEVHTPRHRYLAAARSDARTRTARRRGFWIPRVLRASAGLLELSPCHRPGVDAGGVAIGAS